MSSLSSILPPRSELLDRGPLLDRGTRWWAMYLLGTYILFRSNQHFREICWHSLFQRKWYFSRPHFMTVMVITWSKLYTLRAATLNRLTYALRDSRFPYLMLIRESESRCSLLSLIKSRQKINLIGRKSAQSSASSLSTNIWPPSQGWKERSDTKSYQWLHKEALEPWNFISGQPDRQPIIGLQLRHPKIPWQWFLHNIGCERWISAETETFAFI